MRCDCLLPDERSPRWPSQLCQGREGYDPHEARGHHQVARQQEGAQGDQHDPVWRPPGIHCHGQDCRLPVCHRHQDGAGRGDTEDRDGPALQSGHLQANPLQTETRGNISYREINFLVTLRTLNYHFS